MFHPPDKEGWIFHLSNSVIVWESVITYVTEERARGRGIEEELRTESALWGWFSSWFQCEYDQKNRYHCLLSCGKRFVSLSPRAPLSLKSLTLLSRRICTFIKMIQKIKCGFYSFALLICRTVEFKYFDTNVLLFFKLFASAHSIMYVLRSIFFRFSSVWWRVWSLSQLLVDIFMM